MLNAANSSKTGLLYVDDEEKALKYFRMAFGNLFETFTAASGDEGLRILEKEAPKISIVISDQRMPGMLGAEFLGRVRERHPRIIRMLTTAYSDLDSAIEAVNRGHIYQYVSKPWDVDALSVILQRADDYFHVLAERDHLLALKMTTLQRILCSDRLKWLLIHSRSLSERKQSAFRRALRAFVRAMPAALKPVATAGAGFQQRNFEISGLVLGEYRNAARCLDLMNAWVASGDTPVLPAALAAPLERLAARDGGETWSVPDALGRFLAASGPECASLEVDGDFSVKLLLGAGDSAAAADVRMRELFGLLLSSETPEVSVLFFETLLALSLAGGEMTVSFGGFPGEALRFQPVIEPDGVESLVESLYEAFSQTDISAL